MHKQSFDHERLQLFDLNSMDQRTKISQLSHACKSPTITAHDKVYRFLVLYFYRTTDLKKKFDTDKFYEMHLISQWFQGCFLTKEAIFSGLYIQAASLIRQELELTTALKAASGKQGKEGKTPNVGNVLPKMKSSYKNLSEIMHLSRREIITELTAYQTNDAMLRPTNLPQYNEAAFLTLLGCRTIIMMQLANRLANEFDMDILDSELNLIKEAVKILEQEGVIKPTKHK